MAKSISRIQKRTRRSTQIEPLSRVQNYYWENSSDITVDDEIGRLVEYLNGEHEPIFPVNRRVLRLAVGRFQQLDVHLKNTDVPLLKKHPKWPSGPWFPAPEIHRLCASLNRILRRYQATPEIHPDVFLLGGTNHVPQDVPRTWQIIWLPQVADLQIEMELVLMILRIARAGKMSSFKRCAECGKWLFARFSHQRFCGEDCKEHFHMFNEADKKRRRDWAKNNYQTRKELELGSRKAAQRKGGKN